MLICLPRVGDDYDPASIPDSITFAPGSTTICFNVTIVDDAVNELQESFEISFQRTGSASPDATAQITVIDNDGTIT